MIIKPEIFRNNQVKSIQSTRIGGSSEKPYDSMNLGVFGQDNKAQSNLNKFSLQYQLPHIPIFLNQVEYADIPLKHGEKNADACFTRQKGVICSVLSADCLPVLMANKQATVVAAVHCGWRGLYADILLETIKKLNVDPGDLQCWLGPCISYKPYQVDEKFRNNFF